MSKTETTCSWCGKGKQEVPYIIEGPSCYICNECVDECSKLISGRRIANAIKAGTSIIQFPKGGKDAA